MASPYQSRPLTASEEKARELLISLPFFDAFGVDDLDILARCMSFGDVRRGEYLFLEGDPGEYMCFVVQGVLDVLKKDASGGFQVIARLGKGSTIGEMSLVDNAPRSAAVIARQPSTVLMLTRKGFDHLTATYPVVGLQLLKKIMRLLSLHMRRTTSRLADVAPARAATSG